MPKKLPVCAAEKNRLSVKFYRNYYSNPGTITVALPPLFCRHL
ncbi:hypothetical protein L579_1776 [Pantoea sp. AS-PWVM4]|nr:hypothetical protein L579_1776 [Pantoea sp. AS-PWVM4]